MISCLPDHEHYVTNLFNGLRYHLAVEAILGGDISGSVYTDNISTPQWAFTRTRQRCFLTGVYGNETSPGALKELLNGVIIPQMRADGFSVLMLFFTPGEWVEKIPTLFPSGKLEAVTRQHYLFDLNGSLPKANLPAGFLLRFVDNALLAEPGLLNMDALREEMCSERHSVEEFLEKSFGVVAFQGQTLAGWCLSEYNCGGKCEVGIGTQEPYRRRGLATALGCAFLREAQSRGITRVGWDCFADNLPSVSTALHLGFHKQFDYNACLVWF